MPRQRRSTTITPQDAPSPWSAAAFQRPAHQPIKYRVWIRWPDGWAGLRDRWPNSGEALLRSPADTVPSWLDRLHAEYLGAIEAERLAAHAAISVLGSRWANAAQTARNTAAEQERAAGQLAELNAKPIDPSDGLTAGERYEDVDQRHSRREAACRRERAALSARIELLVAARARAEAAMAGFADAISAHWSALIIRVAALSAHYMRRASTYLRSLERRQVASIRPPAMVQPEWARGGCPWAPELPTSASVKGIRDE